MDKFLFFFNDQGIFRFIPDYLEVIETFFSNDWGKCLNLIQHTIAPKSDIDKGFLMLISANCEIYLHNLNQAFEYTFKAQEIEKEIKNPRLCYQTNIVFARIFRLLCDYEQAEHFLSKINGDFTDFQSYLIERALLNICKLNFNEADFYLNKLNILEKEIKFTLQLLSLKFSKLACYHIKTEYLKFENMLDEIEILLIGQKNPYWNCLFRYYKAQSYFYKKDYCKAISYSNIAIKDAEVTKSLFLLKNCSELALNLYENNLDYETAYLFHLKTETLNKEYDNFISNNRLNILKQIFEKKQNKLKNQEVLNKANRVKSISLMSNALTYEIDAYLSNIKIDAESIIYWYKKNHGSLPSIFIEEIKMILEAVEKTNKIINQMKTYWEIDDFDENDTVCLNDLLNKTADAITQKLVNSRITLNLDLSENDLIIKANRLFVEQIFINLFNNSIKAFERSDCKKRIIIVSGKIEKQNIILYFIDNATGLPEISHHALFDPFTSKQSHNQGMGLGLALVKNFLDRFSGFIKAYNNDIGGATFEIAFPYANEKK